MQLDFHHGLLVEGQATPAHGGGLGGVGKGSSAVGMQQESPQASRDRLLRRLGFLAVRRGIGCPEMSAAAGTDPELVRSPRHALARVSHVHLSAAALTADMEFDVGHD
jgi:hypothetical protein